MQDGAGLGVSFQEPRTATSKSLPSLRTTPRMGISLAGFRVPIDNPPVDLRRVLPLFRGFPGDLLHQVHLDLLDIHELLPLAQQEMVHLLVQVPDLQLRHMEIMAYRIREYTHSGIPKIKENDSGQRHRDVGLL